MSIFEDIVTLEQAAQNRRYGQRNIIPISELINSPITDPLYQYVINTGNELADYAWNQASEHLVPYVTDAAKQTLARLAIDAAKGPHLRGTTLQVRPIGSYPHPREAITYPKLPAQPVAKSIPKSIVPTRLEMALSSKRKIVKRVKPKRKNKTQSFIPKTYSVSNAGASVISSSGSIRVKHREYIADVFGMPDGSFSIVSYAINPGNFKAFPWLATIAARFDRYVVHRMHFMFMPSSAMTTVGSVLLAADMDASDPVPINKVVLMSMKNSTRCAPWGKADMILPVDTIPRYTRQASVPAGTDVKTYDIANFFIATNGLSSNVSLGELYVEYDISLMIPHLLPNITSFNIQPSGTFQGNISDLWRGTDLIRGSLNCGPVTTTGSAGQIYMALPPGSILFYEYIVNASAGASAIQVTIPSIGNQIINLGSAVSSVQGAAQYSAGFLTLVQPIANPDNNHTAFAGQFIASFSAAGSTGTVNPSGTSLSLFLSEVSTFN